MPAATTAHARGESAVILEGGGCVGPREVEAAQGGLGKVLLQARERWATMNFLFRPKQRTPHEVVRLLREHCQKLGVVASSDGIFRLAENPAGGEPSRKVRWWLTQMMDEVWQVLQQAKLVLYGEGGLSMCLMQKMSLCLSRSPNSRKKCTRWI